MMKFLRVFVIPFLGATLLLGYFFFWQGIFLSLDQQDTEEKLFRVASGQDVLEISENLEEKELIKNKLFFQVFVFLKRKENNLQAGDYFLSPAMSAAEIAQKIYQGESAKIRVTIPEGFNLKQIEERINEQTANGKWQIAIRDFKVQDFKKDYNFLKETPDNLSLEGFLFPDTYDFNMEADSEEVVKKMLANFDKKLISELRQKIQSQEKTIFEVIVMASLLEKEVKTLEDKKIAASILWKRLANNVALQVDATIIYITGKKTTKVSLVETKIDSPYNTYKYPGLPLGPICSPGLESIKAAIEPQENDYWYYLSTPDGQTIFSNSLEEHNIAKIKYLD